MVVVIAARWSQAGSPDFLQSQHSRNSRTRPQAMPVALASIRDVSFNSTPEALQLVTDILTNNDNSGEYQWRGAQCTLHSAQQRQRKGGGDDGGGGNSAPWLVVAGWWRPSLNDASARAWGSASAVLQGQGSVFTVTPAISTLARSSTACLPCNSKFPIFFPYPQRTCTTTRTTWPP